MERPLGLELDRAREARGGIGGAILREEARGVRGGDIGVRLAAREQQARARQLAVGDQLDGAAERRRGRIRARACEVRFAEIEEIAAEVVRGRQMSLRDRRCRSLRARRRRARARVRARARDAIAVGAQVRDQRRGIAVAAGVLLVQAVFDPAVAGDQHGPAPPAALAADLARRDDDAARGGVDEHGDVRRARRALRAFRSDRGLRAAARPRRCARGARARRRAARTARSRAGARAAARRLAMIESSGTMSSGASLPTIRSAAVATSAAVSSWAASVSAEARWIASGS